MRNECSVSKDKELKFTILVCLAVAMFGKAGDVLASCMVHNYTNAIASVIVVLLFLALIVYLYDKYRH